MTITHCLIYYSKNYQGGVQRYVEEIQKYQQRWAKIQIVTTDQFADKKDDFAAYRARSHGIWQRTPLAPKLLHLIGKLQSDIIHFHSPNPLIDIAAAHTHIPYVTSIHNTVPKTSIWIQPLRNISLRLLQRNLQRTKKIIIHHKPSVLPLLQDIPKKIWNNKVVCIPPGVDHKLFRPDTKKRSRTIVFIAHIRPEKGLHILRKALPLMKEKYEGVHILGSVSYFQKYFLKEQGMLKKLLGKKYHIDINPQREILQKALQSAGCFVCPSYDLESWNLALLEGAACGAPIVKTDLPSLNWLPNNACYTAKARDPRDLAKKIDLVLSNPKKISANALQVSKKYHWITTAQKLFHLYRNVLQ